MKFGEYIKQFSRFKISSDSTKWLLTFLCIWAPQMYFQKQQAPLNPFKISCNSLEILRFKLPEMIPKTPKTASDPALGQRTERQKVKEQKVEGQKIVWK